MAGKPYRIELAPNTYHKIPFAWWRVYLDDKLIVPVDGAAKLARPAPNVTHWFEGNLLRLKRRIKGDNHGSISSSWIWIEQRHALFLMSLADFQRRQKTIQSQYAVMRPQSG